MIEVLQQRQSHQIWLDSRTHTRQITNSKTSVLPAVKALGPLFELGSRSRTRQITNSETSVLPAVKALGPLFKLSEVHLWDHGPSGGQDSCNFQQCTQTYSSHQDRNGEKWGHSGYMEYQRRKCASNNGLSSSPEDVKVAKKMNDLPPASYTNKEKRHEMKSSLCKNEMMPSGLCLIASTTERKCLTSRQTCLYVAKESRSTNNDKKARTTSDDEVLQEDAPSISKYWSQRYQLFSRFDYGIKMDEEGWFSVTPEAIAKHQAIRCGNGVIADLFTGVGGNSIQFAQRSKRVIAIDIDPNKIDYARHNASIYEVDDKINFINADCFSIAPKLKADTVFMSPPWGGPNYRKVKRFDISTMLEPRDGLSLFDIGKGIAPRVVMFLPRNVDINQLAELALSATPPWSLEVEKNFLNGRLKAITAYFVKISTT